MSYDEDQDWSPARDMADVIRTLTQRGYRSLVEGVMVPDYAKHVNHHLYGLFQCKFVHTNNNQVIRRDLQFLNEKFPFKKFKRSVIFLVVNGSNISHFTDAGQTHLRHCDHAVFFVAESPFAADGGYVFSAAAWGEASDAERLWIKLDQHTLKEVDSIYCGLYDTGYNFPMDDKELYNKLTTLQQFAMEPVNLLLAFESEFDLHAAVFDQAPRVAEILCPDQTWLDSLFPLDLGDATLRGQRLDVLNVAKECSTVWPDLSAAVFDSLLPILETPEQFDQVHREEQTLASLFSLLHAFRSAHHTHRKVVEDLNRTKRDLEEMAVKLRSKLHEAQASATAASRSVQQLEEERAEAVSKAHEDRQKAEMAAKKIQDAMRDTTMTKEVLRKEIDTLNTQLAESENRVLDLRRTLALDKHASATNIYNLKEQLDNLQRTHDDAVRSLCDQKTGLTNDLQQKIKEMESQQMKFATNAAKTARLEARVGQYEAELQKLHDQLRTRTVASPPRPCRQCDRYKAEAAQFRDSLEEMKAQVNEQRRASAARETTLSAPIPCSECIVKDGHIRKTEAHVTRLQREVEDALADATSSKHFVCAQCPLTKKALKDSEFLCEEQRQTIADLQSHKRRFEAELNKTRTLLQEQTDSSQLMVCVKCPVTKKALADLELLCEEQRRETAKLEFSKRQLEVELTKCQSLLAAQAVCAHCFKKDKENSLLQAQIRNVSQDAATVEAELRKKIEVLQASEKALKLEAERVETLSKFGSVAVDRELYRGSPTKDGLSPATTVSSPGSPGRLTWNQRRTFANDQVVYDGEPSELQKQLNTLKHHAELEALMPIATVAGHAGLAHIIDSAFGVAGFTARVHVFCPQAFLPLVDIVQSTIKTRSPKVSFEGIRPSHLFEELPKKDSALDNKQNDLRRIISTIDVALRNLAIAIAIPPGETLKAAHCTTESLQNLRKLFAAFTIQTLPETKTKFWNPEAMRMHQRIFAVLINKLENPEAENLSTNELHELVGNYICLCYINDLHRNTSHIPSRTMRLRGLSWIRTMLHIGAFLEDTPNGEDSLTLFNNVMRCHVDTARPFLVNADNYSGTALAKKNFGRSLVDEIMKGADLYCEMDVFDALK